MPLQIIRRDITKMEVDAIVNTTNSEMKAYSGVDFAIHQAAGPALDEACKKIAPLGLGSAKITKGYGLKAKYVIHTSGPVWRGGLAGESILLRSCYLESLKLAVKNGCESVAFPLISSGTYGYPKDRVLTYAVEIITEFLYEHELTVYLCVFDRCSYEFSKTLFAELSRAVECEFPEEAFEEHRRELRGFSRSYDTLPDCCSAPEPPKASRPAHKAKKSTMDGRTLEEYLKEMDKPFAYKLFDWIDARGMTDVECYKKANVDKKTFSKIKCNPDTYKPSKQTAVAFAIALQLDMDQTQDLLASAGLALSRSVVFDRIIRYFIHKGNYDIFEINQALFEFDQTLLGV